MSKANLIRFVVIKNGRTGIYLVSSDINMSLEKVQDIMDEEIKHDPVFGQQCIIHPGIIATAVEVNADWIPFKIINKKVF